MDYWPLGRDIGPDFLLFRFPRSLAIPTADFPNQKIFLNNEHQTKKIA